MSSGNITNINYTSQETPRSPTINLVTINLGGKDMNPFEYFYGTFNENWDYETTLKDLTKDIILRTISDTPRNKPFLEYVKNLSIDTIISYFFLIENYNTSKEKLTLENKFGRSNSNIKRFNPVEFGYCPIYFDTSDLNQFEYVRKCGQDMNMGQLLQNCIDVPFLNGTFNFENTDWLSENYSMDKVFNIILYDMMKTYAVYQNWVNFSKIYVSNSTDTRINDLVEKLDGEPTIVVTQEGCIRDERFNFLYRSPIDNGVEVYSLNCNVTLYKVFKIPDTVTSQLGNKKAVSIQLLYQDTLLNIRGLHCKEPKDEITYESFVNDGLLQLNSENEIYYNYGALSKFYYCLSQYWYDIDNKKTINIILGDFNPKDDTKSSLVKKMIVDQTNYNIVPIDESTTSKTRSGYCAQYKKFWNPSKTQKDLVIVDSNSIKSYEVFPPTEQLLSDTWCGDHSSVICTINL